MNISNRKNLPEIIVNAVKNDPYDAGEKTDYSATQLIRPAYQVALQNEHADEISEDVADMLWALYGTAVHYILERGAGPNDIVEERLYGEIGGYTISAQLDHYGRKDQRISDWKLTGSYKIKKAISEHDYEDWEQQLNIQAWLAKINGFEVSELYIGAMCRDWSAQKFKDEEGYPDQIEYIQIPLWTFEEQEQFIAQRIAAMISPQPCSQQERWQPESKFALMKVGGSRAAKVGYEFDVQLYAVEKGFGVMNREDDGTVSFMMTSSQHFIEEREGPNRRCEGYCNVNTWCKYYQDNYATDGDVPF